MLTGYVATKLNFSSAFNSIHRRDKRLRMWHAMLAEFEFIRSTVLWVFITVQALKVVNK